MRFLLHIPIIIIASNLFCVHIHGDEIFSKRDLWSKTYINSNGTNITNISSAPIHYVSQSGNWLDINTQIVPTSASNFDYINEDNFWITQFLKEKIGFDVSTRTGFQLQSIISEIVLYDENKREIVLDSFTSTSQSTCNENKLFRKDVFPFVDIMYCVEAGQIIQSVVFRDINALSALYDISKIDSFVIKQYYSFNSDESSIDINDISIDNKQLVNAETINSSSPVIVCNQFDGIIVNIETSYTSKQIQDSKKMRRVQYCPVKFF